MAPERLRILDPHPSLLARWHACTANTGMTFLRSGAVHHLDLHSEALTRFANEPAGQPYRRFIEPYRRPALDLFNAHAAHVIERHRLHERLIVGRACGLARAGDGWRVETAEGSIAARHVALALGAAEQPHWPAWAQRVHSADAPIQHIFAPTFCRADLPPWTHAVVVGGGISAAQTALTLAQQQPGTVTLLTRHALRKHDLDSDPGWIGPKYQAGFQQITDYMQRRTTIQQARHRGSVPPNVAVQIRLAVKSETLRLVQAAVTAAHGDDQGQIRLILADGAGTLTSDRVILATGFDPQRPGGAWLDATIAECALPVAPCGYPLVNQALCWADGLYVLGPLAELELGPVARNITGARQAAERISRGGDTHRAGAAAQDVGIDHGRLHISMTRQLLHGADIVANLKEMGGETMAKSVAGNPFGELDLLSRSTHRLLEHTLIEMMASNNPRARIGRTARGGEAVLPGAFARRSGQFTL